MANMRIGVSQAMLRSSARALLEPGGRLQVAEVTVRGGYRPAVIRARAGVPLRLVFERQDADHCTERIVFSEPRLDRRLVAGGRTTIDLPAQPPGRIRFTCGMGRYRGRIEFVAADRSLAARLRDHVEDLDTALGTAIVLWICSLPLVAAVAWLLFDLRSALIAAVVALVAWLAGCVWAFSWSQSHA